MKNLLNYFKVQLTKTGVKVELNKEATPEAVKKFAPDAVIVAVGSTPFIPDIPGVKGDNVLTCREVLSEQKKAGKKVVVWEEGMLAVRHVCSLPSEVWMSHWCFGVPNRLWMLSTGCSESTTRTN